MANVAHHLLDRVRLADSHGASMVASFEVHLEWPYHAVLPPSQWPQWTGDPVAKRMALSLLEILTRRGISATWYVLGDIAKSSPGLMEGLLLQHQHLGSHGYWHQHGECEGDASDQLTRSYLPSCVGYRSPFWETTPRPGMAGGVFFRLLPYPWLLAEINRTGRFWIHPHDLLASSVGPLRRKVRTCNLWQRLNHVLDDVHWRTY